jgi:hypothetical protein
MPNFWTKAGQFISEAISKNKTKDEDYKLLYKQMKKKQLGILNLKSKLKDFSTFTEPFIKYIKTLNEAIYDVYKDSPVKIQIELIINKHELVLKDIDNLSKIVLKLYSKTSAWDTIFDKARASKKERGEKRKNFDHYEQKLLKLEDKNPKKNNADQLARNQEKYSKALKEYLDTSEKSYELIKNSIKLSWELTNPIIGELIISEKNMFENITQHLFDFANITNDLKEIMEKTFNPEATDDNFFYDPKRCIRNQTLMIKNEDNYIHRWVRKTNTFGKVPIKREHEFMEIIDDFS